MKKISFSLLLLLLSYYGYSQDPVKLAESIPNPRATNGRWIYQEIDILKERESQMNSLIDSVEKATGVEIAVAVIATIGENDPDNFTNILFNTWKIGKQDKNNGILIIQILNQRFIRIETGYGMEERLPDVICSEIIDKISIPHFKENNFSEGHFQTLKAIISCIKDSANYSNSLASIYNTPVIKGTQNLDEAILKREENLSANINQYRAPFDIMLERITKALYSLVALFFIFCIIFILRSAFTNDPLKKHKYYIARPRWINFAFCSLIATWSVYLISIQSELLFFAIPFTAIMAGTVGSFLAEILFFNDKKANALRNEPRICKCGKKMYKLGEKQEDEYLDELQEAEELVQITNYDVWLCKCGEQRKDEYPGKKAHKCAECKNKTVALTGTQVIKHATYSSTGLQHDHYKCGFCGKTEVKPVTISKKVKASSSSRGSSFGGGSSGGGGSSFGGGSSGGGGSSRRY